MELFLDLYGNSLIKEKSSKMLENMIPELIKILFLIFFNF